MFYYGILIQDLFKRNFFENNLKSRLKSISGFILWYFNWVTLCRKLPTHKF